MTEPLDEIEAVVAAGGDADDVLRRVVAILHERAGCAWAGILFVEEGELVLGPAAGDEQSAGRTQVPVLFHGDRVAELAVDGAVDEAILARVAELIADHCLVGWDTGGEEWNP